MPTSIEISTHALPNTMYVIIASRKVALAADSLTGANVHGVEQKPERTSTAAGKGSRGNEKTFANYSRLRRSVEGCPTDAFSGGSRNDAEHRRSMLYLPGLISVAH